MTITLIKNLYGLGIKKLHILANIEIINTYFNIDFLEEFRFNKVVKSNADTKLSRKVSGIKIILVSNSFSVVNAVQIV